MADLRLGDLPPPWRYAVTRDSRIYFINDETMSTSWLHPLTGQPVQTGYRDRKDLPSGWEEAVTPEGAPYFVDHREKKTTFKHPVTGQTPTGPRDYILMDRSTITDSRSTSTVSFQDEKKPNSTSNKSPMDVGILGGTLKEPKKTPPSPTPSGYLMRGWLNKQDHGRIKSWRKRWFVLTNRGLLYYKNEGESNLLGSIVLIGYKVEAISASPDKSRSSQKHAFKLTHPSQRQYIFSAETREDMVKWLKALNAVTTTETQANSTNNVPSPKQNTNNQRGKTDEIDDAGFNLRDRALRPRVVSSSSQEGNTPTSSQQSGQNGYQPNYRSPQYQENRHNSPNYVQYRPKGDRNGHAAPRPVTYHAGMAMTNNVPGSKPSSVDTDSGYHGSERRPVQNSRSDSRLLPYANDPRSHYRMGQPPDPRVVQRSESMQRLQQLQQWKSQTLERQGKSRSDLSTVEEVPRANYRNYQQDNGSSSNYSGEHRKGVYPDSYKTLPRHTHAAQLSPKYNANPPSEESWHISTLPRSTSSGYKAAQDQYYQNYVRSTAWQHNTPADPKELKREESMRQLSDWRQRTLSSTTSQGSGPSSGPSQSRNYEDVRRREPTDAARKGRPVSEHFRFPETRSVDAVMRESRPVSSFYPTSGVESPPPIRPPLPAAYRHQDYGVEEPDAALSRGYRTAVQEAPKLSHAAYNHVPETKKETNDAAYSLEDIDDVFANEVPPSPRPNYKLTSSDLMGKSHEELTLLLIQLKRDQDQLVEEHNDALSKMMAYTRAGASGLHSPHDEEERWKQYEELRRKCEESERKLNASKPMLSLVSNMVKLGDLYNTPDNRHNKQYDQFGRRTNPELANREQFEFSRQLEEQQVGTANSGLQHSPSDDKLVNIKSMRIRELDGHMQELTARVTVLKEDMENLERTLHSTSKKMSQYRDQPQEKDRYASLQAAIQSEISKVRADLAQESKKLEAFSGEHGQLSNELRAVHSRLWEDSTSTTASSPSKASEKAAMKNRLQQDLAHVQNMMTGLAQQRDRLEGHFNSIRQQFSGGGDGPFVETDLDTGIQHDLRAAQQAEREHQNNDTHAREEAQHQRSVPTILVHKPDNNTEPSQNSGVHKSSLSVRQLKRESAERRSRDRQVVGGEADGHERSRSPPKRSNTLPGRPRDQTFNNMTARSLKRVSRSSSDVSRLRIPSSSSSDGGRRRKPSAAERLFGDGGGISRSAVDLRTLGQHDQAGRFKSSKSTSSILKKPRKTKPRPDFSAPVEPFHGTTDLETSQPENSPKIIETDIEPVEFDLDWNRELLPPSKTVLIPERYVSDTESEESLTPEEQAQRRRKAAKFQKLLSNYSMQDLSKANSEREKKDRAHILSVQAALASQVKQESRKMARSPHLERKTFTVPEDRGTYL